MNGKLYSIVQVSFPELRTLRGDWSVEVDDKMAIFIGDTSVRLTGDVRTSSLSIGLWSFGRRLVVRRHREVLLSGAISNVRFEEVDGVVEVRFEVAMDPAPKTCEPKFMYRKYQTGGLVGGPTKPEVSRRLCEINQQLHRSLYQTLGKALSGPSVYEDEDGTQVYEYRPDVEEHHLPSLEEIRQVARQFMERRGPDELKLDVTVKNPDRADLTIEIPEVNEENMQALVSGSKESKPEEKSRECGKCWAFRTQGLGKPCEAGCEPGDD